MHSGTAPRLFYYTEPTRVWATLLACGCFAGCVFLLWLSRPWEGFSLADAVLCAGAVLGLAFTVLGLWSLLQSPVAIRMDEHGVSGVHFPGLAWSDIEEVAPQGRGSQSGIGVRLKDRKSAVARWSLWEKRFLLKLPSGYDFVFLTDPIEAPRHEILDAMNSHLRAQGD